MKKNSPYYSNQVVTIDKDHNGKGETYYRFSFGEFYFQKVFEFYIDNTNSEVISARRWDLFLAEDGHSTMNSTGFSECVIFSPRDHGKKE
ncbi:MAG: hypothetical protein CME66_02460 [Halobacteriovoraceae bacterium]|jgi:hypothetical protein|nr:hypothetical protein [Halobacteriovoraceae bacterium]|tara:strand:- start:169 stop:438 length:270 start_codon:yes stop_codon:yes gene_type:complete